MNGRSLILALACAVSAAAARSAEPDSDPEVAKAIRDLGDERARVRCEAADTLASFRSKAKAAVPRLTAVVRDDKDLGVRIKAVEALIQMEADAAPALPVLIDVLGSSEDVRLRRRVVCAIGNIPGDRRKAVPVLVKLLQAKDPAPDAKESTLQSSAANTLGNIGADAREAAPALFAALQSDDQDVRAWSLCVLGRIKADPERLVPIVIRILRDPDQKKLWPVAAGAVQDLGPDGKPAIPALLDYFGRDDFEDRHQRSTVREHVLQSLGAMGKDGEAHIPWMLRVAKDPKMDEGVRIQAFRSLGGMKTAGKVVIPGLIGCLNDREHCSRYDRYITVDDQPRVRGRACASSRRGRPPQARPSGQARPAPAEEVVGKRGPLPSARCEIRHRCHRRQVRPPVFQG